MELKGYSTYDLVINEEERVMYWKHKDSKELHKIFDINLKSGSAEYYASYVFDELERIGGEHSMGGCFDFELDEVEEFMNRYKQVEEGNFTSKVYKEVLDIIKESNCIVNSSNGFSLSQLMKAVRNTENEELMWKTFEYVSSYLDTEQRVPAGVIMDLIYLLQNRLHIISRGFEPMVVKFKDACIKQENGLYIYTTKGDKYYCEKTAPRQYRRGKDVCDRISTISLQNTLDTLFKLTFIDVRPTSYTNGKLIYNKELSDLMYSTFTIDELAKLHLPTLVKEDSKEMNLF